MLLSFKHTRCQRWRLHFSPPFPLCVARLVSVVYELRFLISNIFFPSTGTAARDHPILCACVGEAVDEYFKAFKLEIYNSVKKKKGTMEAGREPGCLCFCFWLLLTWVVDNVIALIFKQFEMQFDPLVIIKMQELEIYTVCLLLL